MTWLHCCKYFWWFHYADTKDAVFVWFHILTCLNCVSVLIILEFCLIICLQLTFLILFLLLRLLVRACRKNHHIFMPQETIFQVYICAPFFLLFASDKSYYSAKYVFSKSLYNSEVVSCTFVFFCHFVFVFLAC